MAEWTKKAAASNYFSDIEPTKTKKKSQAVQTVVNVFNPHQMNEPTGDIRWTHFNNNNNNKILKMMDTTFRVDKLGVWLTIHKIAHYFIHMCPSMTKWGALR